MTAYAPRMALKDELEQRLTTSAWYRSIEEMAEGPQIVGNETDMNAVLTKMIGPAYQAISD